MKISIPEKSKVEVSDHSDDLENSGQPKRICNRLSREGSYWVTRCFWVIAATNITILFVLGPMIVLSPKSKSINPWSWIYQRRFDDNSDRDAKTENFGDDSDILVQMSTPNATKSIQQDELTNRVLNNRDVINSILQDIRNGKWKMGECEFEIEKVIDMKLIMDLFARFEKGMVVDFDDRKKFFKKNFKSCRFFIVHLTMHKY